MFAIMPGSVRRGFVGLSRPKGYGSSDALTGASSIRPYTMLALNLLTQLICVAGVNQLSSVCTSFYFFDPHPVLFLLSHRGPVYFNYDKTGSLTPLVPYSISPFVNVFVFTHFNFD